MPAWQQPSSWLSRKGPGKWQHWWGGGSHGCFVAGAQPRSCPSLPAKLLGANPQCPAQKPHPKSQAWLALLFWHVKTECHYHTFTIPLQTAMGPWLPENQAHVLKSNEETCPYPSCWVSTLNNAIIPFWSEQFWVFSTDGTAEQNVSHIDKKGKGRKQKPRATFWPHPCQHPTGHQPGCRTSKTPDKMGGSLTTPHRYTIRNGWSMPGWPHRSGANAWQKVGRTAIKIHNASNKGKGMLLEQRVTCNGKPFTLHMPLFLFWS